MPLPLLSYAFRPFFLLAAAFAVFGLLVWVAAFRGASGAVLSPWWHAHEMTLGFGGAVVAGFLLTAVATWTGRAPVRGGPLIVLLAAWLAGRVAMLVLEGAPAAAIDLLFPLLLTAYVVREVVAGGSRRNFGVAVLVALLAGIDAYYHFGNPRLAVHLLVHLLGLLIVVIGGRVVPAFTGNWLRMRGTTTTPPAASRPVELAVVPLTALAGLLLSFAPGSTAAALASLAAGALNALRLARWRGFAALSDPLVFVLHAAYAWLAAGYLLLGAAGLLSLPLTAGVHALAVGGIGGMILAMMTRVSLGHTGRSLRAPAAAVLAYVLLGLAALLRTLSPFAGARSLPLIDASAAAWALAFAIFLVVYFPVLYGPRADAPGADPLRTSR